MNVAISRPCVDSLPRGLLRPLRATRDPGPWWSLAQARKRIAQSFVCQDGFSTSRFFERFGRPRPISDLSVLVDLCPDLQRVPILLDAVERLLPYARYWYPYDLLSLSGVLHSAASRRAGASSRRLPKHTDFISYAAELCSRTIVFEDRRSAIAPRAIALPGFAFHDAGSQEHLTSGGLSNADLLLASFRFRERLVIVHGMYEVKIGHGQHHIGQMARQVERLRSGMILSDGDAAISLRVEFPSEGMPRESALILPDRAGRQFVHLYKARPSREFLDRILRDLLSGHPPVD